MRNKLLILIFALNLSFCKSEKTELKSYLKQLERVNSYILENTEKESNYTKIILKEKINEFPFLLNMIQKSELCAINHYPKKGIVYKFRCKNNSSDNFIFSDDKFYLIKILNNEKNLLNYAQYVDYSRKPIELSNNWFLIEQNITYD